MSAVVCTIVLAVERLSAVEGSSVGVDTTATFVSSVPLGTSGSTIPVMVSVVCDPGRTSSNVQVSSRPLVLQTFGLTAIDPTPSGRVSITVGAAATNGPPLVTLMFQVIRSPATTSSAGVDVLTIDRSAAGWFVLVNEAELFAGSLSGVSLSTETVLVTSPPPKSSGTAMVTTTSRLSSTARSPISQVIASGPAAPQLPVGVSAEMKANSAGRLSVTDTAPAADGPELATVMV